MQEELTSAAQQTQGIERTMREITTINQMISTAVMQQAEMIEALYNNAVDATQVRGSRALVRLLLCSCCREPRARLQANATG
jgi:t-SNARE complex subunit (syntaxin)